jgi:hypothetical protein
MILEIRIYYAFNLHYKATHGVLKYILHFGVEWEKGYYISFKVFTYFIHLFFLILSLLSEYGITD